MSLEQAMALIKNQELSTELKLWDDIFADIRAKLTDSEPPEWHKRILDDRLADPNPEFQSWADVKNSILKASQG